VRYHDFLVRKKSLLHFLPLSFNARRYASAEYATTLFLHVRPSVRPSVRSWCFVKVANQRLSSRKPCHTVDYGPYDSEILTGVTPTGASNRPSCEVGKIFDFRQTNNSKTVLNSRTVSINEKYEF